MILDTFPTAEEFYKTYWGKKPFIVRGYIPHAVIDTLIDGDTLAGLALEDDIRSRIITNNAKGNDWVCEHGPFEDDRFDDIGDKDWSLLVQNVEQYHTDSANLLPYFQFSPRWLLDDIMVSFSAPGGSVGPHTDSYHTFLVQGIGKRAWKISDTAINDDRYADNPDMKVLQHGFEGKTYEVSAGDVIYMPPFFGHEGKTIEAAMTFSVGFLGPKLSEMLGDYALYLEENEELNQRFLGNTLDINSAGFCIGATTQHDIQQNMMNVIRSDDFTTWLTNYFSTITHDPIEGAYIENEKRDSDNLLTALEDGDTLIRPEQIKPVISTMTNGDFLLSIYGESIYISAAHAPLINALNHGQDITIKMINDCDDKDEALTLMTALYNNNALILKSDI